MSITKLIICPSKGEKCVSARFEGKGNKTYKLERNLINLKPEKVLISGGKKSKLIEVVATSDYVGKKS